MEGYKHRGGRVAALAMAFMAVLLLCATTAPASAFMLPNPRAGKEEAAACGYIEKYWTVSASAAPRHVCHPDGVMSIDDMMAVDAAIEKQRYFFDVGVVVVANMPEHFATGKGREDRVRMMAEVVHDSWGVGNADGLGFRGR